MVFFGGRNLTRRIRPLYPAAMTTTGRAAAAGPPPPDATSSASLSRPEHGQRISTPAGDHGVIPGGAEPTEERHVGLVQRLAAGELIAEAVEGPAAGGGHDRGVGAQAVDRLGMASGRPSYRARLLAGPAVQRTEPAGGRRQLLRGRGLLRLGRRASAVGAGVGGGRARFGRPRVSLGQRLGGWHLQQPPRSPA